MKKTGNEFFDSDDFRELLAEYEDAVNSGQPVFMDADELADIADYYQMENRIDEADSAIELALSLAPGAIAPLTYKIHEALWYGDTDKARQYLEQITETDEPDYVYDTAEIMLAEGDVEKADEYLRSEFMKVPPEEYQDYVIDVANIYADYNYPDKAMQWMTRARQEESTEFKELMARTLFGLGKYKDSEKLWGELIDSNPFSKHYWNALASTQFMNEDYSHAVESSEYAIAIDPTDPEGLLQKANGLYYMNNYEEALNYYQRYSKEEPDDEYGLLHQGSCLINLGRNSEAIDILKKAAQVAMENTEEDGEQSPCLGEIYQELAFAYCEAEDTQLALQMLDKADTEGGDKVQTLIVRGHIMLTAGRLQEAEHYFRKAVMISDTTEKTLLRIIVAIYDNHYLEAAYNLFHKYFSIIQKDCSDGFAYMALCCYDMNKYDEFLTYLKTACERNPRECQIALSHLFPDNVDPNGYYDYIKDRMKSDER